MSHAPRVCRGFVVLAFALPGACHAAEPRFRSAMVLGGHSVAAETLNRGSRVYQLRCVSCHGADGSGQGPAAQGLRTIPPNWRENEFRVSTGANGLPADADRLAIIRGGRVERGMPSWKGMPAADLDAVVQYLKTFSPGFQERESPVP